MNALSTELLCEVVSHLSDTDLCSIRLVNKRFDNVATGPLFHTFRAFDTNRSIERMGHILGEERSRKSLKVLVYDGETFGPSEYGPSIGHTFEEIVLAFAQASCSFKKLRIRTLGYSIFHVQPFAEAFTNICPQLTSLKLKLACIHTSVYYGQDGICDGPPRTKDLQQFLRNLRQLTTLDLELPIPTDMRQKPHPLAALADIIPLDQPWFHLRKLSLAYFDTAPEDFIQLMRNHASSLKVLRLMDIRLYNGGEDSWIPVMEETASLLSLDTAAMRFFLSDVGAELPLRLWDMHTEHALGAALEHYLVHGGECPLQEDNCCYVLLTR